MSEAAVVGGSAIEVSGVYLVPRLYMNMSFALMMHFKDDKVCVLFLGFILACFRACLDVQIRPNHFRLGGKIF